MDTLSASNLIYENKCCKVYKIVDDDECSSKAVKVYDTASFTPKQQQLLSREITIHKDLVHENIVRMLEDRVESATCHVIETEFCENGNLWDYINNCRRAFSEERFCKNVVVPLLSAVDFIHKKGYIHRDIKPENIFVDAFGGVKIGDLGSATTSPAKNYAGTIEYMAPEVQACKQAVERVEYDFKVDVYSLGKTFEAIIKNWEKYPSFKGYDTTFASMIASMTMENPQERPSIEELLKHTWVLAKST